MLKIPKSVAFHTMEGSCRKELWLFWEIRISNHLSEVQPQRLFQAAGFRGRPQSPVTKGPSGSFRHTEVFIMNQHCKKCIEILSKRSYSQTSKNGIQDRGDHTKWRRNGHIWGLNEIRFLGKSHKQICKTSAKRRERLIHAGNWWNAMSRGSLHGGLQGGPPSPESPSASPRGLVKAEHRAQPQGFCFSDLGGLRNCLSNKFPGDVDAAVPEPHFENHRPRGRQGRAEFSATAHPVSRCWRWSY